MEEIGIDAGKDTEELLLAILDGVERDAPDAEFEIRRSLEPSVGLGGEPVTTGAVLLLAGTTIPLVVRVIERWLENSRQRDHLKLVANAFEQSSEAGQALKGLSERHAGIAISYPLIKPTVPKAG